MEKVIKNMVCPRCVESVESIVKSLNLPIRDISIGSVDFERKLDEDELEQLSDHLKGKGFELVTDRETELANLVKLALIEYLSGLETNSSPKKISSFIGTKLHYNYSYLSHVFTEQEGETIETFLIKLKIERVKELISYRRFTLSEIAHKLKYSSVQYLSNQFKKVTGQTVTEYRKSGSGSRISIDKL